MNENVDKYQQWACRAMLTTSNILLTKFQVNMSQTVFIQRKLICLSSFIQDYRTDTQKAITQCNTTYILYIEQKVKKKNTFNY